MTFTRHFCLFLGRPAFRWATLAALLPQVRLRAFGVQVGPVFFGAIVRMGETRMGVGNG
jgi:hypothetical protein